MNILKWFKDRPGLSSAIWTGAWIGVCYNIVKLPNPPCWQVAGAFLFLGLTFSELIYSAIFMARLARATEEMNRIGPLVAQAKAEREEEVRYDRDLQREKKQKLDKMKPGPGNAVAIGGWGWKDPSKDD